MAFSPNGRILASADWDGGLIFWEKASGKRLLLPIQTDSVSTNDIDFSPDGSILATVGGDNQIRLWDANPASEKFGKEWASFPGEHSNYLTAVAFHPKREILITASEGSDDVILWDIDPNSVTFGKMITNFPTEHRVLPIWAFHFDRTGERLVSIKPVEVTIWDMSTHPPQAIRSIELPVTFLRLSGRVMSFDPATFVLAFAAENIVNFFNLDPNSPSFGEVLSEPLEMRGARINALAFSPEEGFLASGDRNGSLQLWDAITKQPLGPFLPGTDPVNNLTFSPDGSTLAVGGTRGSVILWDMQLDSWKERACQRANRNLTEEEWRRFFGDEPYRETCPGLPASGS
jgi:WD40 repeat protein